MSETVIPSSARMSKAAKNMRFVGSREGGATEDAMTKKASMKHENPEYFKRQSDQKKSDRVGMKQHSRNY